MYISNPNYEIDEPINKNPAQREEEAVPGIRKDWISERVFDRGTGSKRTLIRVLEIELRVITNEGLGSE